MSRFLSPGARKALAVYAATDDMTRERLAKVRRLTRTGRVRYWLWNNEPRDLQETTQSGRFHWGQLWGERAARAERAHKLATAAATLRRPLKPGDDLGPWTPVMQAADLEAQAVIGAITLREKGAPLTDEQFVVLTAAWRKARLPL